MDRLVYFLLGLIIGAFIEPTLALLCRDLAKLILYKKIEKQFQRAVEAGNEEASFLSQHITDTARLTVPSRDKAKLN